MLLRLPLPQGLPAVRCLVGAGQPTWRYYKARETITIEPEAGNAEVVLEF